MITLDDQYDQTKHSTLVQMIIVNIILIQNEDLILLVSADDNTQYSTLVQI